MAENGEHNPPGRDNVANNDDPVDDNEDIGEHVALLNAIDDMTKTMHDNSLYTSLVSGIPIYDWTGHVEPFRVWIQDIDKLRRLMNDSEEFTMRAVVQTTRGLMSEFVQRQLDDNERLTWVVLKQALKDRFGLHQGANYALMKIKTCYQKLEQTFQIYSEELNYFVPEAFPGSDRNDPLVQRELVNAFTQGVNSRKIRDKLIRSQPKTLADAVKEANSEFEVMERIKIFNQTEGGMRYQYPPRPEQMGFQPQQRWQPQQRFGYEPRREEPMEVDATRFQFTEEGRPICNFCGKIGHIYRDCFKRQQKRDPRPNQPSGPFKRKEWSGNKQAGPASQGGQRTSQQQQGSVQPNSTKGRQVGQRAATSAPVVLGTSEQQGLAPGTVLVVQDPQTLETSPTQQVGTQENLN